MATLSPFELIKKGATGLINQGKGFFNAPDNSTAGIIKNTVLGLPKATGETAKDIAQGTLRGLGTLGSVPLNLTRGELSSQIPQARTPEQQKIDSILYGKDYAQKPITFTSEGGDFLSLFGKGKEGTFSGKYVAPVIGMTFPLLDALPGGKPTKTALQKLGPEVVKMFAKNTDQKWFIKTLVSAGVDPAAAEKASIDLVKAGTNKQVENILEKIPVIEPKTKTVVKETQPRERGFITSAKEAVPEAATRIGGQYIPRSTDELAIKARNEITDNIDRADAYVRNNSDDKATAIAAELIKKYADDALKATDETTKNIFLDKAASIANDYAHKLTESGRSIQAASILSRLTPEGQVRFAAREIQKYNDLNPTKKIPELTGQQAENIINKMENINKLDDGMEKTKAFKELQDEILDLVPTPVMKKIVNVWKAGLLTGIKTTGLNIFSNLTHQATEIAKDVPAAIVDSVVSLFTKKRTKTFTLKGEGGGVSQGFNKGWDYFKSGVDERNIGQKLDYSRVSFGKGPVAKAFQKYTEVVFRSLGAGDQPFYYGALSRSLMDQALAMGKNKGLKGNKLKEFVYKQVENPTEDMIRYATADAATAVFQNETYLGNAAKKIQEIPIVGEILVPFARTPSSVAMQVVRYTPVGTAGTIIEQIAKGKFDQRLFSEAVGRGLTGTAVLAIGTYLYNKGMMALDRPKTEREKEQWKLEGRKENSILINGKWRSPTVLGPAGILLLVGGHFKDALDTAGSPTEAMAKTLLGSVKSFTEQTFLTGISSALNALMDPQRYAESYIGSLVSSVIPTIVSDVARATDKKERRPEGVGDRFKQRIPGVRQTVEPQVDVLGKEVERIGNPLEVMLDPTRPSPVKSSPVIAELRRLTDKGYDVSPTLLGDKKGFAALSKEQNTELWKTAGTIIDSKLNSLFAKEEYQSLSAEKKSKVVTKIIDQAKVNARAAMAVELTVGLSGEALKSKLSELKKGGLLTEEVFNKYKEIR
jgi:hypothetical protein